MQERVTFKSGYVTLVGDLSIPETGGQPKPGPGLGIGKLKRGTAGVGVPTGTFYQLLVQAVLRSGPDLRGNADHMRQLPLLVVEG